MSSLWFNRSYFKSIDVKEFDNSANVAFTFKNCLARSCWVLPNESAVDVCNFSSFNNCFAKLSVSSLILFD